MGNRHVYERFIWFEDRAKRKKYPNASGLAREFETSVKTAQRDITFMRDRLNCPLLYDRTKKGYFYNDDTFALPLIHISSEEIASLLIARKLLKDISGGYISDEISAVLEKITAILKQHIAETDLIDNTLSFQLIAYSPTPEGIFKSVLEGCLKKRPLTFIYQSPAKDEVLFRTVDPYHLLNYMGTWHLIAYCHKRRGIRNFVLHRMRELNILNEPFAIHKDFTIAKHLCSAFGLYKGTPSTSVTLRFTPEKSKWIEGQIWHKEQKEKVLKDGSLELSVPVVEFAEIIMEILKHGSEVEVIKPKGLRELIKSEAKKISKLY